MRSAKYASKRLAVSSPARKVRRRKLMHVVSCPFCSYERREIAVDTGAIFSAREDYPKGVIVEIHEDPDQRLFVFGGDFPSGEACKHLAMMWGSCDWESYDPRHGDAGGCVDFNYNSPPLVAHDIDLEIFLKERVVTRNCGQRFMPSVPVRCRKINKQWQEPARAKNIARNFQLTMRAYFAVDPLKLFEELAIKHAAFQEHCRE